MNAETLRRAAAAIRESVEVMADETGSGPDLFMLAVAHWLEVQAGEGWTGESLAVARAYLGESA